MKRWLCRHRVSTPYAILVAVWLLLMLEVVKP